MAFKHQIDKETFNSLHTDIQKEYSEKDGNYYLQVEGMVPQERYDEVKSKVDEFRENNVSLLKKRDELVAQIEKYGQWTPEAIADLEVKAKAGGVDESKLKELVDSEVSKRTSKMQEENEKTVNELTGNNSKMQEKLRILAVDNELKSIAVESGVRASAIPDILLRGRGVFHYENDSVVAKNEKGDIIYGKDGKTSQSMAEWLGELKQNATHLFEESTGTGGKHKSGSGAANNTEGLVGRSKMSAARSQQ